MSTRSVIIIKKTDYYNENNPNNGLHIFQYYHHSDGYVSGVGFELFNLLLNKIPQHSLNDLNSSLVIRHFFDKNFNLGYEKESTDCIHGDLEYIYEIDFDNGIKLTVFKSAYDSEECLHEKYLNGTCENKHVLIELTPLIKWDYFRVQRFSYDFALNG